MGRVNIVGQLHALSKDVRHLESVYVRRLTALCELKQSLLTQALSGQL